MRFNIQFKIQALNIAVLLLILINVGTAASNFKQIGIQSKEISEISNKTVAFVEASTMEAKRKGKLQESLRSLEELNEEIQVKGEAAINMQFSLFVFNIVFGTVLSFIISNQITRPLKYTVEQLRCIARGDLTQSDLLINTTDEVADMAEAMNEMKNDLSATFSEIFRTALEVERSSHAMAESTRRTTKSVKDIASGAKNQAKSVHEASESMEEMNATIKTVIDSTQQALFSSNAVNKQAEDGEVAVSKTIEAMKQIEESSGKIEAIVSVITDITNQTNLLSLNAAIEAAKAGEMGKGFAVVADEVRHLAERSAGATSEIFDLITESTDRVNNGTQLVEHTGKSLHEIMVSVKQTSGLIDAISSAITSHRTKTVHVEDTLKILDSISQTTVGSTGRLSKTTESLEATAVRLENVAERLHETVEQFKLPDMDQLMMLEDPELASDATKGANASNSSNRVAKA
ncbi:HAMP domain-containing methyl-accepting chemotaxis protein [Deltaproteobacteria bacterium TL4]